MTATQRVAILWSLVACGVAQAQYGGEPATVVGAPTPFSDLGPAGLGNGVTAVGQLELRQLIGAPPGVFYLAASVQRTGGVGGFDAMTGIWDSTQTPTVFTENGDVDALNTAGDEFSVTLSHDLLVLAMDTPSGPGFSVRTSTSDPFPPLQMLGAPLPTPADPAVFDFEGDDQIAFVNGTDIWVGALHRSAFGGVGPAVDDEHVAVRNPSGYLGLRSPHVLIDEYGGGRSLLVAMIEPGGRLVPGFAGSPFDLDTPKQFADPGGSVAFPASFGGTTIWPQSVGGVYVDPVRIDLVGSTSELVPLGGDIIDIAVFGPIDPANPTIGVALVAGWLGSTGVPIPGIYGLLGLMPSNLFVLPIFPVAPDRGVVNYLGLIQGPAQPSGFEVQPVVLTHDALYLGNVAVVRQQDEPQAELVRPCSKIVQAPDAQGRCPAGFSFEIEARGTPLHYHVCRICVKCEPRNCPAPKSCVPVPKTVEWPASQSFISYIRCVCQ